MNYSVVVLIIVALFPITNLAGVSATDQKTTSDPLYNSFTPILEEEESSQMVTNEVYYDIVDSCSINYMDIKFRHLIKPECLRIALFKNFATYFDNLGSVQNYWINSNYMEKRDFIKVMEYASPRGMRDKPYDWNELHGLVTLLYGLEATFSYFNYLMSDDVLSGNELADLEFHLREYTLSLIGENSNKFGFFKSIAFGMSDEEFYTWVAPRLFIVLLYTEPTGLPIGFSKIAASIINLNDHEERFANSEVTVGNILNYLAAIRVAYKSNPPKPVSFDIIGGETL